MNAKTELSCMCCGRVPSEIEPYIDATIRGEAQSPDAWVRERETTLNRQTWRFVCPGCYACAVAALCVYEALQGGKV